MEFGDKNQTTTTIIGSTNETKAKVGNTHQLYPQFPKAGLVERPITIHELTNLTYTTSINNWEIELILGNFRNQFFASRRMGNNSRELDTFLFAVFFRFIEILNRKTTPADFAVLFTIALRESTCDGLLYRYFSKFWGNESLRRELFEFFEDLAKAKVNEWVFKPENELSTDGNTRQQSLIVALKGSMLNYCEHMNKAEMISNREVLEDRKGDMAIIIPQLGAIAEILRIRLHVLICNQNALCVRNPSKGCLIPEASVYILVTGEEIHILYDKLDEIRKISPEIGGGDLERSGGTVPDTRSREGIAVSFIQNLPPLNSLTESGGGRAVDNYGRPIANHNIPMKTIPIQGNNLPSLHYYGSYVKGSSCSQVITPSVTHHREEFKHSSLPIPPRSGRIICKYCKDEILPAELVKICSDPSHYIHRFCIAHENKCPVCFPPYTKMN